MSRASPAVPRSLSSVIGSCDRRRIAFATLRSHFFGKCAIGWDCGSPSSIEDGQNLVVARDIPHRLAVPGGADDPISVEHDDGREPAKPSQLHFLPKALSDLMLWIGNPVEGDVLALPIPSKCSWTVRCNRHDLDTALLKLRIVLTQLRQMPTAVWSAEPAQKDEHNRSAPQ